MTPIEDSWLSKPLIGVAIVAGLRVDVTSAGRGGVLAELELTARIGETSTSVAICQSARVDVTSAGRDQGCLLKSRPLI